MRIINLRIPMIIVAVAGIATAQSILTPRRVSKSFPGEVPFLWTFEGNGKLISASLRVVDESGREVLASAPFDLHQVDDSTWQVVDSCVPLERFKTLDPGRYIAEWSLTWGGTAGPPRRERVESVLNLGEVGDGWLQQAFQNQEGLGFQMRAASQWNPGSALSLEVTTNRPPKSIQYQVIEEQSERPLMTWTVLPLNEDSKWSLLSKTTWPQGAVDLWVKIQDSDGVTRVQSQQIWLGQSLSGKGGLTPVAEPLKTAPVRAFSAPAAPPPTSALPTWTTFDWLNPLDGTPSLPWEQTNRVATVNVGYLDEERNGVRLWPTDAGRPMSLSITGADKLGKPLYSISYLLAEKASGATELATIADQALLVSTGPSDLPPGAATLDVGKVLAPVVMSPGRVDDFLGKPLAAGFGWAANISGVPISASDWTTSVKTNGTGTPEVGLAAIRKAADLRWWLLQNGITLGGYRGTESIQLDNTRDPFGLTVASQDPLNRPILSKSLGSPTRTSPSAVTVLAEPAVPLSHTFGGSQPSWIRVNGRASVGSTPTGGLILQPPVSTAVRVPSTVRFQNLDGLGGTESWDINSELPAGTAVFSVGKMVPNSSINVAFTAAGPLKAYWILDGREDQAILAGSWTDSVPTQKILNGSSLPLTVPAQIALKLVNGSAEIPVGQSPTDADRALLTGTIQISLQPGAVGLDIVPAVVNAPSVPGYSHTQYGTVEIEGEGRCTVTMMTDPDGSAVAEVKDPEGRTIYKIVNPDGTYTSQFLDYLGSVFQPSAPKARGMSQGDPVTDVQRNLVTQYLFDDEGHLRLVVPPKGVSGGWGFRLSDAQVLQSFAWDGSPESLTPIPYATHNAYDASGHLIASFNPDEGLTLFKVDQKGRVHYSQTASQRTRSAWTRTLYDAIYRVVAVGEIITTTSPSSEGLEAVTPATYASDLATLSPDYLSKNYYDTYVEDPLQDTRLDSRVQSLLPTREIWGGFADGHLVQTSDAHAIERYYYDQDGRIVIRWATITGGSNTNNFAIGIFYDFAGRVKRLIYPSGPGGDPLQVVYTYDDLGRLFAVGTPSDKGYFARYAYHPTGELRSIVYGPGEGFVAKRMLQDPQGWLRQLSILSK